MQSAAEYMQPFKLRADDGKGPPQRRPGSALKHADPSRDSYSQRGRPSYDEIADARDHRIRLQQLLSESEQRLSPQKSVQPRQNPSLGASFRSIPVPPPAPIPAPVNFMHPAAATTSIVESGDVDPRLTDSTTLRFLHPERMVADAHALSLDPSLPAHIRERAAQLAILSERLRDGQDVLVGPEEDVQSGYLISPGQHVPVPRYHVQEQRRESSPARQHHNTDDLRQLVSLPSASYDHPSHMTTPPRQHRTAPQSTPVETLDVKSHQPHRPSNVPHSHPRHDRMPSISEGGAGENAVQRKSDGDVKTNALETDETLTAKSTDTDASSKPRPSKSQTVTELRNSIQAAQQQLEALLKEEAVPENPSEDTTVRTVISVFPANSIAASTETAPPAPVQTAAVWSQTNPALASETSPRSAPLRAGSPSNRLNLNSRRSSSPLPPRVPTPKHSSAGASVAAEATTGESSKKSPTHLAVMSALEVNSDAPTPKPSPHEVASASDAVELNSFVSPDPLHTPLKPLPPPPLPASIHDPNSLDYDYDLPDVGASWPTSPIESSTNRASRRQSRRDSISGVEASRASPRTGDQLTTGDLIGSGDLTMGNLPSAHASVGPRPREHRKSWNFSQDDESQADTLSVPAPIFFPAGPHRQEQSTEQHTRHVSLRSPSHQREAAYSSQPQFSHSQEQLHDSHRHEPVRSQELIAQSSPVYQPHQGDHARDQFVVSSYLAHSASPILPAPHNRSGSFVDYDEYIQVETPQVRPSPLAVVHQAQQETAKAAEAVAAQVAQQAEQVAADQLLLQRRAQVHAAHQIELQLKLDREAQQLEQAAREMRRAKRARREAERKHHLAAEEAREQDRLAQAKLDEIERQRVRQGEEAKEEGRRKHHAAMSAASAQPAPSSPPQTNGNHPTSTQHPTSPGVMSPAQAAAFTQYQQWTAMQQAPRALPPAAGSSIPGFPNPAFNRAEYQRAYAAYMSAYVAHLTRYAASSTAPPVALPPLGVPVVAFPTPPSSSFLSSATVEKERREKEARKERREERERRRWAEETYRRLQEYTHQMKLHAAQQKVQSTARSIDPATTQQPAATPAAPPSGSRRPQTAGATQARSRAQRLEARAHAEEAERVRMEAKAAGSQKKLNGHAENHRSPSRSKRSKAHTPQFSAHERQTAAQVEHAHRAGSSVPSSSKPALQAEKKKLTHGFDSRASLHTSEEEDWSSSEAEEEAEVIGSRKSATGAKH